MDQHKIQSKQKTKPLNFKPEPTSKIESAKTKGLLYTHTHEHTPVSDESVHHGLLEDPGAPLHAVLEHLAPGDVISMVYNDDYFM